jgi:hypothetical protein
MTGFKPPYLYTVPFEILVSFAVTDEINARNNRQGCQAENSLLPGFL